MTYLFLISLFALNLSGQTPVNHFSGGIDLPANHEAEESSEWDAGQKSQLAGKPAPDLNILAINGDSISLASLKGKIVLLDFFTTWCGPCQQDAPAVEKLREKYDAQDLAIIGISVDETRKTVEKYLAQHPKSYPVALISGHEITRPYQVRAYPTYIVIDRDGNVAAEVRGKRGFSDLEGQLKKAGLKVQ
jgi:thiol-disulfide isomerase/thioredoxin